MTKIFSLKTIYYFLSIGIFFKKYADHADLELSVLNLKYFREESLVSSILPQELSLFDFQGKKLCGYVFDIKKN